MKRFKKVYIEITNVCNLSCSFCPITQRAPEFMNLETFENILLQIKPYTDYIYLHVKGEPLLHPDIEKMLDLASEYGFKVNITTNGTLIGRVKDKILYKKSLRQVNFSLHSFDANTQNITIDEYLDNIFTFTREAAKNTEVLVSYRLWNLEEEKLRTARENNTAYAGENQHILERIETAFDLDYKIEEVLVGNRGIKLLPKVYLNQAYEFKWPELQLEESDNKGFCYGLKDQIAILVDGTVVPCCLDGEGIINLGNIKESSFETIINDKRAKDIYEGFSRHEVVEELCKKCDYRRRF
ncbi:radical SAM/SPASM domain-containing protein [Clostridium omnivorum]|uniref:Radical SAM domain protein n=1 Tax=Clostridium omnivorum TaxID=1604902 RepID=A0ABQ5N875_9CLOT|nr:radical SAM/SPASM domain-containing protein [Clostridium sp. E14]GLC31336.1 radical SAM domain protein [Clostridium sp. E14]